MNKLKQIVKNIKEMISMNKLKHLAIVVVVAALLAAAGYSGSKTTKVTDDITLEDIQECSAVFWNEEEPLYGTCTKESAIQVCEDEPFNTSCTTEQRSYEYACKTGVNTIQKSREECKDKEMQVTVAKPTGDEKYKIEYGDWGKCSYAGQGEGILVTCDSKYDGNNDGICQSGETCAQFRINKGGMHKVMKNSRHDFVEEDESFFLEELNVEVLQ